MNKYDDALAKYQTVLNDEIVRQEVEQILKNNIETNCTKEVYKTIFGCLDLTTLKTTDNDESVAEIAKRINIFENEYPDINPVAGICIYPNFITAVRGNLDVSDVNIVSVAGGFPSAQTYTEVKTIETGLAIHDGADEIDAVMSVGNFLAGNYEEMCDEISEIKDACREAKLKIILESGILGSCSNIKKASILSIYAGADFIKTSTGKIAQGATCEAVYVMCTAINEYYKNTGTMIGIKVSGGITSTTDAVKYYTIVKEILGEEWLTKDFFRIGAGNLANKLLSSILDSETNFF
ncbi:MAG: deoxyribose-phosphate aldolase [Bacteroidales bacterium]